LFLFWRSKKENITGRVQLKQQILQKAKTKRCSLKSLFLLQQQAFCSSFCLDTKRSKKIKDKRMAPPVYPASAT